MDYYRCPPDELRREILRRGYIPCGGQDELSEGLNKDDEARGTEATTVETAIKPYVERKLNLMRTAEFGNTVHPKLLVGEKIIFWTMNTFFPALQLFFESGLSCTIEGARLLNCSIDLDRNLRFRLTDLTHEEDGALVRSTLPEKFSHGASIRIVDAAVARRTSVAVKPTISEVNGLQSPSFLPACVGREAHMVVGLRLEGMKKMAYVWARTGSPSIRTKGKTWGDVRIAGLRDDVPMPFFGFPQKTTKMGGQAVVVAKGSMIRGKHQLPSFGWT